MIFMFAHAISVYSYRYAVLMLFLVSSKQ